MNLLSNTVFSFVLKKGTGQHVQFVRCCLGVVSQTLVPRSKEKCSLHLPSYRSGRPLRATYKFDYAKHFAQELFRKGVRGAKPQIDLVITLPLPRIMHEQSRRMLQMKPLRAIRMAG
jgi:hypothetical protein